MPLLVLAILLALAPTAFAQALAFDVAAIHPTQSNEPSSTNVPLGPGQLYTPTGGTLTVHNQPLINLIAFAYKLTGNQIQTFNEAVPAWVREQHFDINARTDKPAVTKDELRAMTLTLLNDRFAFAAHYQDRVQPIFALQLVQPGKPGPRLRPHPADGCSRDFKPKDGEVLQETTNNGYPTTCGGLVLMPASTPTHFLIGARDIPIKLIADAMPSWGDLGRPVIDATGLTGHYDFTLEYTPKRDQLTPNAEEPDFLEAIRKQLGLRLEPQKQSVPVLVLDHIDHLTGN